MIFLGMLAAYAIFVCFVWCMCRAAARKDEE